MNEMIELLAHPKLKNVETKIPSFIIVDDIADEAPQEQELKQQEVEIATIEVVKPVVKPSLAPKTAIVVKESPKEISKIVEPFI